MNRCEPYEQLLRTKGIPLQGLGISEIALERSDVLLGVDFLRKAGIPILGGDVYFERDGRFVPALENWFSDPKPQQEIDAFFRDSWISSSQYVESFPEPERGKVLFTLVTANPAAIYL